jgi:ketosteroid isomerase-like protein
MNRFVSVLIVIVSLLLSQVGVGQNVQNQTAQDTVDVAHVMDAFHEAVVKHDAERLSALFLPEGSTWVKVLTDEAYARMRAMRPEQAKIQASSYKDFAKFVSGSKANLDPQHTHVQIHTDGTIASVYFDFVFFIDGKAENRGSETWQLVKGADGWRIVAITYSSDPKA